MLSNNSVKVSIYHRYHNTSVSERDCRMRLIFPIIALMVTSAASAAGPRPIVCHFDDVGGMPADTVIELDPIHHVLRTPIAGRPSTFDVLSDTRRALIARHKDSVSQIDLTLDYATGIIREVIHMGQGAISADGFCHPA